MNERKRSHRAKKARRGAGPSARAPAAAPDVPKNPYLENLIKECYAGGAPAVRMRRRAAISLDTVLDEPAEVERLTGRKMEDFLDIQVRLQGKMMSDRSRPIFRDDHRCISDESTGLEIGHLLLMLLMEPRGGPVQDGLAAIFNMDGNTASEYLEYGRSVLKKVLTAPEAAPAEPDWELSDSDWSHDRIMDALHRGAYDEVERIAPDLFLLVSMQKTFYDPEDEHWGQHAVPPDSPDRPYHLLTIITRAFETIDAWAVPQDHISRLKAFKKYLEGDGRYLKELTRRLPDGRRWKIVYGGNLGGMEELFPEADVEPINKPQKRTPRKKPHPAERKIHKGPKAARRPGAGFGGLQKLFPRADINPEGTAGRAETEYGKDGGTGYVEVEYNTPAPDHGGPVMYSDPGNTLLDLTCGKGMLTIMGLEPGEDGQMLLDGRVPPGRPQITTGGAMAAVLLQLRGTITLDDMEKFYGISRKEALSEVRRAMDLLHDSLATKPEDIADELKKAPGTGISGDHLNFGCLTVPVCRWRPLSGPHRKAIFVADSNSRIVGLGDSVDGDADRRGMIQGYLAGKGRHLARLIRDRKDDLTIYAGSRLVELEDELPENLVKRYIRPKDRSGGIRGKITMEKMAAHAAGRDKGVLNRILDALEDYKILERSYGDRNVIVGSYDDEWYPLDRTLQVLCGMVNLRMQIMLRNPDPD
ncbi:hypothetical protein CENSYa_2056 [Cenarchaeum symbiosum A]|uniref:Uncharacterized protein n=1 Tax=Cenarchaeum symbiosum (strain A) TaxID=414004 RepID=A0RZ92_CENSY|nr:hypothetical protein CENSYa_2056 [Cenarchaeum symbiosum A]